MTSEESELLLPNQRQRCCGNLPIRRSRKALAILLIVQMLERAGFYVITLSVVTFSTFFLNLSSQAVTATSVLFTGTTYFISPFFGWLADRKTGPFLLLSTAFLLYALGAGLIAISAVYAVPSNFTEPAFRPKHFVVPCYIVGLFLVCVAASSVRAILIPFMLEQIGDGSEFRTVVSSFCSVAYFFINVGGALATGLTLFLCGIHRPWIQSKKYRDPDNYFWLFLSGLCFLLAASVVLFIGKSMLKSRPIIQKQSFSLGLWSIVKAGCVCCERNSSNSSNSDYSSELQTNGNAAAQNQKQKGDRDSLANLVPVLSSLIIYWITEVQYTDSFTEQSLRMDFGFNSTQGKMNYCNGIDSEKSHSLPRTITALIDPLFVLLFIPLYHWIIKPIWEATMKREITILDRIMLGLVFSLLGCLSATVVEVLRVQQTPFRLACLNFGHTNIPYIYSPLSILYQIPQYCLVGVSEVFALIAAIEFVLSKAPKEVRYTAFGFYQCVAGIGYYFGALIIFILTSAQLYYRGVTKKKKTIPNKIAEENSKAYAFFVCLDILVFGNILVFARVKYRIKLRALMAVTERK